MQKHVNMATGYTPKLATQVHILTNGDETQKRVTGSMLLCNLGNDEELPLRCKHDPFRMSVLDFQRASLDKLAEILKLFIVFVETEISEVRQGIEFEIEKDKAKKNDNRSKEEKMEDVSWLLKVINRYCSSLLGGMNNLASDCKDLIRTRNAFAHEAYIKVPLTPFSLGEVEWKTKSISPNKTLMKTRTFHHTEEAIDKCIKFAKGILLGAQCLEMESKEGEKFQELSVRVDSLETLKTTFKEFSQYRELESVNSRAFFSRGATERKQMSLEVLEMMKKRIKEDDLELEELVSCVFASRCCVKLSEKLEQ